MGAIGEGFGLLKNFLVTELQPLSKHAESRLPF